MSLLPIVRRELRVASLRRSTYRIRWWTALLAIGISFFSLVLAQVNPAQGAAGGLAFGLLAWGAFGLCLLSGVFLTADVLSEEKRGGTLGLLFLTDLKGYDVVLGKFMAQWLNAFYGLLAVLPALALPLLLGGVTGGQFWRTVVALIGMLFFSLAVGIWVSALGWNGRKTMGTAFWLLLLVTAALPLLASVGSRVSPSRVWSWLNWVSPFSCFSSAGALTYARQPELFWGGLLVSGGLGSLFLAMASLVLPRAWQERDHSSAIPFAARVPGLRDVRPVPKRARQRRDLLEQSPLAWLAGHGLGPSWGAWMVVFLWACVVLVLGLLEGGSSIPFAGSYSAMPFGFCLKAIFALHAGRLLAEHRRSGALELLLCTPLTSREILRGQLTALIRTFRAPFVAFISLLFAPVSLHVGASIIQADWAEAINSLSGVLGVGFYAVRFGVDLVALFYFANGLALTLKRPHQTPGLTLLLVLVVPSIFSVCQIDMVADICFIIWGANKTGQDLRRLLNAEYQPVYALNR